jgi:hypothetical protein
VMFPYKKKMMTLQDPTMRSKLIIPSSKDFTDILYVDLCTLGGVPHVLSLLSTCGKVIWHFVLCPLCLFCT